MKKDKTTWAVTILLMVTFLLTGCSGGNEKTQDETIKNSISLNLFNKGVVIGRQNDDNFLLNESGEVLGVFDFISDFASEGFFSVRQGDYIGYVNNRGEMMVYPAYEGGSIFSEGLVAVQINNKVGFIDKDNNMVIQPQYRDAEFFVSGVCPVNYDGQWGIINREGEWVVEPEYSFITHIPKDLFYAGNEQGDFVLNTEGAVLNDVPFDHVLYRGISRLANLETLKVKIGDKFGVFNNDLAELVVYPIYEDLTLFTNNIFAVKLNGEWGIIKSSGEWLAQPQYQYVETDYIHLILHGKTEEESIYMTRNGDIHNTMANAFNEGLMPYQERDETLPNYQKMGYVDAKNNQVIAAEYDFVKPFEEGIAVVSKDGLMGAIDKKGKSVIPFEYTYIDNFYEGMAAARKSDDAEGFIDTQGNWLFDMKLDSTRKATDIVYINDNMRIGKERSRFFDDGYARVETESGMGVINQKGEYVIQPIYDKIYIILDPLKMLE